MPAMLPAANPCLNGGYRYAIFALVYRLPTHWLDSLRLITGKKASKTYSPLGLEPAT
ncbi:MAG: hypothetical protein GAK45_00307 [Pseudomonas citronellolis]|nr:MAG: hypothetical protein GAK45_00307 [Pseudomonas citronellolis]